MKAEIFPILTQQILNMIFALGPGAIIKDAWVNFAILTSKAQACTSLCDYLPVVGYFSCYALV